MEACQTDGCAPRVKTNAEQNLHIAEHVAWFSSTKQGCRPHTSIIVRLVFKMVESIKKCYFCMSRNAETYRGCCDDCLLLIAPKFSHCKRCQTIRAISNFASWGIVCKRCFIEHL